MATLVVTGGGTGGHIYPALAIAKEFQRAVPGAKTVFIGSRNGLEAQVVPREGIEFHGIHAAGLERKLSLRFMITAFQFLRGYLDALRLLKRLRPDAVVGTGAYACAPVIAAALTLRIPALLHASDLHPGITIRWFAPFVRRTLLAFEGTRLMGRTITVGTPIAPEILEADRKKALRTFDFKGDRKTLFVVGGSQGAHSINLAMVEALGIFPDMDPPVQVLFMTGFKDYQFVMDSCERKAVKPVVKSFLYNMPEAYAVADLVICRSGAMTLAELTARGLPSILVPYPHAAHDHQTRNAEYLEQQGAAVVVRDQDLSGLVLSQLVRELLGQPDRLKRMGEAARRLGRPEAGKNIAGLIRETMEKGRSRS